MHADLLPVFDGWMKNAEAWADNSADAGVDALFACYPPAALNNDKLTNPPDDVLEAYPARYPSTFRLLDGTLCKIWTRGMDRRAEAVCSELADRLWHRLKFDPPLCDDGVSAIHRWLLVLSQLRLQDAISDNFGRGRYQLQAGFEVRVGSKHDEQIAKDVHFNIDHPNMPPPMKSALEQSAERYGYYWELRSIQHATLAALYAFRAMFDGGERGLDERSMKNRFSAEEIGTVEQRTPLLPEQPQESAEWVGSKEKNIASLPYDTFKTHRDYREPGKGGRISREKTFGIDRLGHRWRRREPRKGTVFYYVPDIEHNRRK